MAHTVRHRKASSFRSFFPACRSTRYTLLSLIWAYDLEDLGWQLRQLKITRHKMVPLTSGHHNRMLLVSSVVCYFGNNNYYVHAKISQITVYSQMFGSEVLKVEVFYNYVDTYTNHHNINTFIRVHSHIHGS